MGQPDNAQEVPKELPYKLGYGKDTLFFVSSEILALQLLKSIEVVENGRIDARLVEIMELEEVREASFACLQNRHQTIKRWFDSKKSSDPEFKQGDLVLKYNERVTKPGQHAKFDGLWEGPFHILG